MQKMKAWVYRPKQHDGSGVFLFLEKVPVPVPGPKELLLRVNKVSVCGTDETLFTGRLRRSCPGIIPGHEFFGEVIEIGPQVDNFRVGQLVAGESHYCLHGSIDDGIIGLWPPRMVNDSQPLPIHGAYSQYICIPSSCAHLLPAKFSHTSFWPSLFEPAGNDFLLAQFVINRNDKSHPGNYSDKTVGIFGCGPHGLYAQIFLKYFGLKSVVAFETDPFRRRFAQELDCAKAVLDASHRTDYQEKVQELTKGQFFDVTIDMVGKSGEAFRLCCELTRDGGTVILFGLFNSRFTINGLSANDLILSRKELAFDCAGKKLTLVGITGREGVWENLVQTVASDLELQDKLMKPVTVVGPLDFLGEEARRWRPQVLKRAFTAFRSD